MASRIRYIIKWNGAYYNGGRALRVLADAASGGPFKTFAQIKAACVQAGAYLWAFRELRDLSQSRSRYKRSCQALGLYPLKKKIKREPYQAVQAPPANVVGGQHAAPFKRPAPKVKVQGNVPWGGNDPQPAQPNFGGFNQAFIQDPLAENYDFAHAIDEPL